VPQISILLGCTQSCSSLALGLVILTGLPRLGRDPLSLRYAILYALGLALCVRLRFGSGLCLCLFCLLRLFALYLRVFSGFPIIENLGSQSLVTKVKTRHTGPASGVPAKVAAAGGDPHPLPSLHRRISFARPPEPARWVACCPPRTRRLRDHVSGTITMSAHRHMCLGVEIDGVQHSHASDDIPHLLGIVASKMRL
jgi:hypothetical protein